MAQRGRLARERVKKQREGGDAPVEEEAAVVDAADLVDAPEEDDEDAEVVTPE